MLGGVGVTEGGEGLHGFELELGEGGGLVVGLVDDGLGAHVELALVLALGLVGGEVVEGAAAEEVLDVDLVLLHVVQREPLRVRRGDKYHANYYTTTAS